MAEQDFKQIIDDAILDADSLEQFINGDDAQTVLTRLSAQYPTLQKAIKELFEHGGIAGRFKTLAALQASPLVDGDYALVADDDVDKNGIYIKEGGSWVKSKYDIVSKLLTLELATFKNGTDARVRFYDQSSFSFVGAIQASGAVDTSGGYANWRHTDYLPVKSGDSITVTTKITTQSTPVVMAFYNSEKSYIGDVKLSAYSSDYINVDGVAPQDGFVRAQHATGGADGSKVAIYNSLEGWIERSLSEIGSAIFDGNSLDRHRFFGQSVFSEVGIIWTDGSVRVDKYPTWRHTDFIEIKKGEQYSVTTSIESSVGYAAILFYDADKNLVGLTTVDSPTGGYKTFSGTSPVNGFIRSQHASTGFTGSSIKLNNPLETELTSRISELEARKSDAKVFKVCDGSYSWWCEPQSCQIDGVNPYVMVGAVDMTWHKLASIDSSSTTTDIKLSYLRDDTDVIPDEHNGAVSTVAKGKVVVFQPTHNDLDYIPYWVSDTNNPTVFGSEKRINSIASDCSYCQVVYSSELDTLYVFYRAWGFSRWYLAQSSDWDSDNPTWQTTELFKDTVQIYTRVIMSADGKFIHCLSTMNAHANPNVNGLWYSKIDLVTGDRTNATGQVIGSMSGESLGFAQLSKIYVVPSGYIRLYDALIYSNKLSITTQKISSESKENGGIYRYLEFDLTLGEVSKDVELIHSGKSLGSNLYFGGAHFSNILGGNGVELDSVGSIYLAREDSGTWYVEQWDTIDNGATWSVTDVIDSSSNEKLWRPRVPFNTRLSNKPDVVKLTWCKGQWTSYTNYNARVMAAR